MGSKNKLKRFKENEIFSNVIQPTREEVLNNTLTLKGNWNRDFFKNENPIVLELGCGKGEYSLNLAIMFPEKNFLGIDIKGARFWRGAKTAKEESIPNVAFLRTKIEFIDRYFDKDEVSEIWLTFSDPQPKDEKGTKRITSPVFIERYKKILKPGSLINVKTDSVLLYELSKEGYLENGYDILQDSQDVYGQLVNEVDDDLKAALEIVTYYENRWLLEGKKTHFLQLKV